MRNLRQITDSLIKSFNDREPPNFIDLRDLEIIIVETTKIIQTL